MEVKVDRKFAVGSRVRDEDGGRATVVAVMAAPVRSLIGPWFYVTQYHVKILYDGDDVALAQWRGEHDLSD